MKKKIIIVVLLMACAAGIWALNIDRKTADVPYEIPAGAEQQKELETALAFMERAFGRKDTAAISRMYGLSEKEREAAKCETGADPVKAGMELLGGFGHKLKIENAAFIAVERMPARFYITGTLNDGRKVRFSLNRTPQGMRLNCVSLI